jgi:hypothetical protein
LTTEFGGKRDHQKENEEIGKKWQDILDSKVALPRRT